MPNSGSREKGIVNNLITPCQKCEGKIPKKGKGRADCCMPNSQRETGH